MTIQSNTIIQTKEDRKTRTFRVVYIDEPKNFMFVVELEKPGSLPFYLKVTRLHEILESPKVTIIEEDPYSYLNCLGDDDLSEAAKRVRNSTWEIVRSLIFKECANGDRDVNPDIFQTQKRSKLIHEATIRFRVSKPKIYDALKRYWHRGLTKNSVLPDFFNCGGKGKERENSTKRIGRKSALSKKRGITIGPPATAEMNMLFSIGLRRFYKQSKYLTQVYQKTLESYFILGHEKDEFGVLIPVLLPIEERPTIRQFRYFFEKERKKNPGYWERLKMGDRRYHLNARPMLGLPRRMAFGSGRVYQIDSTILDCYLISSVNPAINVGRPILYAVVDVFSNMIVGFHISLGNASWNEAKVALFNAFEDKVEYCKSLGINIEEHEWPAKGVCAELIADRGELEGLTANALVEGLGIVLSNTAPYRADWKGLVEGLFVRINDNVLVHIPGFVPKDHQRGDADYRLEACLTIEDLRFLMVQFILYYNTAIQVKNFTRNGEMLRDDIKCFPIDLWEWGIQNRSGALRSFDKETLRANLLQKGVASITEHGIKFKGEAYLCPSANTANLHGLARLSGWKKVDVRYDTHQDTNELYVKLPNSSVYEKCELKNDQSAFWGKNFFEFDHFHKRDLEEAPIIEANRQQEQARLNAQIEHRVAQAAEAAALAKKGLTKTELLRDIRPNRKEEHLRDQGLIETTSIEEAMDVPEFIPEYGKYVPQNKFTELIKKLNEDDQND